MRQRSSTHAPGVSQKSWSRGMKPKRGSGLNETSGCISDQRYNIVVQSCSSARLGSVRFYAIACFYNQNTEAFNTGSPSRLFCLFGESLQRFSCIPSIKYSLSVEAELTALARYLLRVSSSNPHLRGSVSMRRMLGSGFIGGRL